MIFNPCAFTIFYYLHQIKTLVFSKIRSHFASNFEGDEVLWETPDRKRDWRKIKTSTDVESPETTKNTEINIFTF
jgi:hypothetical protein